MLVRRVVVSLAARQTIDLLLHFGCHKAAERLNAALTERGKLKVSLRHVGENLCKPALAETNDQPKACNARCGA